MQFESNFECLSFDPFSSQENSQISQMFKHIFLMTGVKSSLTSFDPNTFSVLNLNIRSMEKFERQF